MDQRFIEFASAGQSRRVATADASAGRMDFFALLGGEQRLREFLFLATFLLAWFTAAPFPDLSDPRLLQPQIGGDLLGQVLAISLTGALAAFVLMRRSPLLPRLVTLPLILTFAAFLVSATMSSYPDVALRRLLLAAFTIFQASVILLLPSGREHFARLLAIAAIIVLAACYIGVALFPHYSIHQASDIAEPGLAGDWRGFFTHKNGAGAAMALLIFIGIFVCRSWSRFAGLSIIALAAVFLLFTHSKSPRDLLPVVFLASYLIPRLRHSLAALLLLLCLPILVNLMTVGSVIWETVYGLVASLISDPSFTGRDVIWRFALAHVAQRPLFGFGFGSFWQMPDLVAEWNYLEPWGYRASDAHNGYLNLAVTTGLVGLALSMCWIAGQACVDYRRARMRGADAALLTLFLQIWLFAICLGGFESVFFAGGSSTWFLMIGAIVGMRFLSIAKSTA
jgi:O-antigen ligase